jgi:hypothetical protein
MNKNGNIIDSTLEEYKNLYLANSNQVVRSGNGLIPVRYQQLVKISNVLKNHFNFNNINFIETGASQNWDDGCVGYFFARLVEEIGGEMISVDNSEKVHNRSITFYKNVLKKIKVKSYLDDSINLINNTENKFNLVHLDSWDLDLKDPVPSMLHGWREFDSISKKVEIGGIIIIDDNYFKGSWVDWNYPDGSRERIDINYEIIGKGAMIYHFCKNEENGWKILSDNQPGINTKIIVKKIK